MRWSSAAPNWKSTRLLIATKCQLYRSTPKMAKQSAQLFEQLGKALEAGEGEEIVKKTKVAFPKDELGSYGAAQMA